MTMSITIFGVIEAAAVILVLLLAIKLIAHSEKQNQKKNLPYLYRQQYITYAGLSILALCVYIWVYSFVSGGFLEILKIFIISLFPLVLGLYGFLLGLNWRIFIYDDTFVYRNIFGKKREFRFSEIEKVFPISVGGYQLVIGKVKISIDIFVMNTKLLEAKITNHIM